MSEYVRRLREKVGQDLLFWPAVACLVWGEHDRLLLVRHVEGRWTLPAGAIDPGETPVEAAPSVLSASRARVAFPHAGAGSSPAARTRGPWAGAVRVS